MLQHNFRKVAFVFDRSISIAFKSGLYGGRYVPRGCNWGAPYFNFRPSARGDLIVVIALALLVLFQFPSLREGRPGNGNRLLPPEISIHAPPRGATDSEERNHGLVQISIRAPPRGATFPEPVTAFLTVFQFPPLREGRRVFSWYNHLRQ